MQALNEFRGVDHVTIHIPDEDDKPICGGRREPGNELYGPHEVAITPDYVDICLDCRDLVPRSELHNAQYLHTGTDDTEGNDE